MAGFFKPKRRRGHAGPNKNEQKVLRSQEAERQARSASLLKEQFPLVQHLSVQLEFITPQQNIYERETRVFEPSDTCNFAVPCPGRCGGQGSFDLAAKIKSVIDARQERSEGRGVCQEPLYSGSSEICNFRLKCGIEVAYASEKESEAQGL